MMQVANEASATPRSYQLRNRFVRERLLMMQDLQAGERTERLVVFQQVHGMRRSPTKLELLASIGLEQGNAADFEGSCNLMK